VHFQERKPVPVGSLRVGYLVADCWYSPQAYVQPQRRRWDLVEVQVELDLASWVAAHRLEVDLVRVAERVEPYLDEAALFVLVAVLYQVLLEDVLLVPVVVEVVELYWDSVVDPDFLLEALLVDDLRKVGRPLEKEQHLA
jgi:hypothetical protein